METIPQKNLLADANWAKEIADLGRRTAAPQIGDAKTTQSKPFVILRDAAGTEMVEYLDETFQQPHHVSGTFAFDDVESFLAYWEIYKVPASLMYASLEPAQFVAVFNEHEATTSEAHTPDWRDHRAQVVLKFSKEWTAWTAKNGVSNAFSNPMEFAQWLEDMLPDVKSPPAGQLQEIVLSMKVSEAVNWKQIGVLANGQIQFTYDNLIDGTATTQAGEIKIPDQFMLSVPIFYGMDATPYGVKARLRYRREGGRIKVWYEIERPHKVVENAFRELYEVVKANCGGVLLGKP